MTVEGTVGAPIGILDAFGLTAKLSLKAWEDIFDPCPPSPLLTEFLEKSNET
jgi:hypothetical protein